MNKHYCFWHEDSINNKIFYVPECCICIEMDEHPKKIPTNNICPYCGLQIKQGGRNE
jgi:hypothetical protein